MCDVVTWVLNGQLTNKDGQEDHFKNRIELGGPKWKFSNFMDQTENNPNFRMQRCNLVKRNLCKIHNQYYLREDSFLWTGLLCGSKIP